MAWLTQGQGLKIVSLIVLIGSYMLAHNDSLPPLLQPYQTWIEFATGIGTVVQAWLIQPQRQEWTQAQRDAQQK